MKQLRRDLWLSREYTERFLWRTLDWGQQRVRTTVNTFLAGIAVETWDHRARHLWERCTNSTPDQR